MTDIKPSYDRLSVAFHARAIWSRLGDLSGLSAAVDTVRGLSQATTGPVVEPVRPAASVACPCGPGCQDGNHLLVAGADTDVLARLADEITRGLSPWEAAMSQFNPDDKESLHG